MLGFPELPPTKWVPPGEETPALTKGTYLGLSTGLPPLFPYMLTMKTAVTELIPKMAQYTIPRQEAPIHQLEKQAHCMEAPTSPMRWKMTNGRMWLTCLLPGHMLKLVS
ncbi:hypothetical protein SDC9_103033 [bioreactor metagenome]|uniref:Uncharacterized protein n=1 Tax=bioreactor metagenome TaxID=1076179 RepID=A0A645AVA1_9ZZZZ